MGAAHLQEGTCSLRELMACLWRGTLQVLYLANRCPPLAESGRWTESKFPARRMSTNDPFETFAIFARIEFPYSVREQE